MWGAAGERGKGQSVHRVHWSPKARCKEGLLWKRPPAVFTEVSRTSGVQEDGMGGGAEPIHERDSEHLINCNCQCKNGFS